MFGIKCCSFCNIIGYVKSVIDMLFFLVWIVEQFELWFDWFMIVWFKEKWGGKVIFKGVLDVEDV